MQPNIDNWTHDLNSCTKNERGADQFPFDRGLKGQRGKENLGAGRIVAWDPASFRHIMVSIKYLFFLGTPVAPSQPQRPLFSCCYTTVSHQFHSLPATCKKSPRPSGRMKLTWRAGPSLPPTVLGRLWNSRPNWSKVFDGLCWLIRFWQICWGKLWYLWFSHQSLGASVHLSSLMPSSSLQVAVSTHHLGHYEFRICDRVLNTSTVSLGVGLRTWRPCKVLPKWEGN